MAFTNTHGDRNFLGVDDRGKMVGEKSTNDLKVKINSLARNCEPGIVLQSIEQVDKVVVITIDESAGDEMLNNILITPFHTAIRFNRLK